MYGYGSFTCLCSNSQYKQLETMINQYKDFMEESNHYTIPDTNYIMVEIAIIDYSKSAKIIGKYAIHKFDCIALRQMNSKYIFIKDEDNFRDIFCNKKGSEIAFHFLNIEERYSILALFSSYSFVKDNVKLLYFNRMSDRHYEIEINTWCRQLFKEKSKYTLINGLTNESETIDVIDYLIDDQLTGVVLN